jgi:hypothetical protein
MVRIQVWPDPEVQLFFIPEPEAALFCGIGFSCHDKF